MACADRVSRDDPQRNIKLFSGCYKACFIRFDTGGCNITNPVYSELTVSEYLLNGSDDRLRFFSAPTTDADDQIFNRFCGRGDDRFSIDDVSDPNSQRISTPFVPAEQTDNMTPSDIRDDDCRILVFTVRTTG